MNVAAIVLAAGASRRLGQPKQLLRIGDETLLQRVLRLAEEAGASPVVAVLGAHFEAISAAVDWSNRIPVINEYWEQGIASSIHAGLDSVEQHASDARGVLILTCDQPRINISHLRAMLNRFALQSAPTIVASSYAGTLGVPAVFPRPAFANLRSLDGDKGARALLVNSPLPVLSMPLPGGDIDIDRPEDLAELQ